MRQLGSASQKDGSNNALRRCESFKNRQEEKERKANLRAQIEAGRALTHRILVIRGAAILTELITAEITEEQLLLAAAGGAEPP